MTSVRQIRERFEARAARYDNPLTAFIGERELRPVRGWVPGGARVLDYGCGTGRTTLDLLRRGCVVTAYDLSPAMVAVARARGQAAGRAAEWTTEPAHLAGRRWPFITCIGVLDYYANPLPLLRALAEHLEPGGTLVVTVPNAFSPLAWLYAAGSRFTVPAHLHTPHGLRSAASQAGLALRGLRCTFPALPPLGLTWVAALAPAG